MECRDFSDTSSSGGVATESTSHGHADFSFTQTVLDMRDTLPGFGLHNHTGAEADSVVVDLERLLQALLLEEGLLEDQVVDPGFLGEDSPPPSWLDGATNSRPQTLRDLRRRGPLGELSQEAQTTLLGGMLFTYGEREAFPSYNNALRSTGGQSASTAQSHQMTGQADTGEAGTGEAETGEAETGEAASGETEEDVEDERDLLEDSAQRLLGFTRSDAGHARAAAGFSVAAEEWAAALLNMADSLPLSPPSPSSPRREGSHQGLLRSTSRERILAAALQQGTSDLDVGEEDALAGSILGYDSLEGSAASSLSLGQSVEPAGHRLPGRDPLGETDSGWGLADTVHTLSSTLRSANFEPSSRTDDVDVNLTDLLQRLASENVALDESLARSVRRILQLGTVLTGQRLSEDEIQALPQVRFEEAEQQHCSICLEGYQLGELLTSLRCRHFFHVDCLARWFRRSTQCPLCRTDYVD